VICPRIREHPETIQCIAASCGHKVLLDRDLAALYSVDTRILNQAVKRNRHRFPEDFMLQLGRKEIHGLAELVGDAGLKRIRAVYAFTEQGVAMLSGVLNSERAIQVNIAIMRAFVQLRQLLASHSDLARKLAAMENKYDRQFKVVFEAIRELMEESSPVKRGVMGFHTLMPVPPAMPAKSQRKRTS
jgi:DNA-binding PadR family transcriptional regulator